MSTLDIIKYLLMGLGLAWILEISLTRLGWWVGIHWGGSNTDRPGWWKYRYLPREKEYRKMGGENSRETSQF